jgi:hypothetical protein
MKRGLLALWTIGHDFEACLWGALAQTNVGCGPPWTAENQHTIIRYSKNQPPLRSRVSTRFVALCGKINTKTHCKILLQDVQSFAGHCISHMKDPSGTTIDRTSPGYENSSLQTRCWVFSFSSVLFLVARQGLIELLICFHLARQGMSSV